MTANTQNKYQAVIGLEVHIQLQTQSKLFCSDSAVFGNDPNTNVSAISLAHPGTLPSLNKKAVEYAVKMGLILDCKIASHTFFDRKHYFYPDLPKGYQTTQHNSPICMGGKLKINADNGKRIIKINHIHLEEDAGKSIHDEDYSYIDYNRAGVALLELVTEPEIYTPEEAFLFLTELRKLVRWIGICDGNMEEGSLRCDANVSIKPVESLKLGTKVEIKNLNSIRNVRRAIDFEIKRQTELLEKGEPIIQQTRSYDADKNITHAQRDKEEANDYRYFTCPDLPPIEISNTYISEVKSLLPELPEELFQKYISVLHLSEQDARALTENKSLSDYFNELIKETSYTKAAANWLLGPVKSWLNEHNAEIHQWPVTVKMMCKLIDLVQEGKLNFSIAASRILSAMVSQPEADPLYLATKMNLMQENNESQTLQWVNEVIASMHDKVEEYQKGKKGLLGLFVGAVKKLSKGKADPKMVTKLLEQRLNNG